MTSASGRLLVDPFSRLTPAPVVHNCFISISFTFSLIVLLILAAMDVKWFTLKIFFSVLFAAFWFVSLFVILTVQTYNGLDRLSENKASPRCNVVMDRCDCDAEMMIVAVS